MAMNMEQLNEAQREAAAHKEGPCLVVAGAGSGKTATITVRVKRLLQSGIKPNRILCCTFTKAAAGEMQERVLKETGQKVDVMTIHALARRMLLPYLNEKGLKLESNTLWIVESILSSFDKVNPEEVLQKISWHKGRLEEPDQVEDFKLSRIYEEYEEFKARKKLIDFGDLLILAVKRMESDEVFRKRWQGEYDYVIVDEFQDTSRAAWALLKLLVEKHQNIQMVGDDWQSLYSFNAADPDIMINIHKELPQVKEIKMGINYRSRPEIVSTAARIIEMNQNQIAKKVTAHRPSGEAVKIVYVPDEERQAERIVRIIQEAREANPGIPFSEFAVLYRTNQQSRPFEEAFYANDLPFTIYGDKHFYELPPVEYMLNCLRVIQAFYKGEDPELRELSLMLRGMRVDWSEIRYLQERGIGVLYQDQIFEGIVTQIEDWMDLDLPGLIIEALYHDIVLAKRRRENKDEDKQDLWYESLRKSADKHSTVESFLEYVEVILERSKDKEKDAIQIMTIHKSKGLEFKYVFVVDMTEEFIPYKKSVQEGLIEEETRVAYVALSRPKDFLYLMVPTVIANKERNESRYIELIRDQCQVL